MDGIRKLSKSLTDCVCQVTEKPARFGIKHCFTKYVFEWIRSAEQGIAGRLERPGHVVGSEGVIIIVCGCKNVQYLKTCKGVSDQRIVELRGRGITHRIVAQPIDPQGNIVQVGKRQ